MARPSEPEMTGVGRPLGETFRVTRLDQIKLLADPLRLRILRAFVGKPRTTMQVAELLGENAPRLYRHVEALRKAGLLRLVNERRKRGTVERYLEAVATRFEVDGSVFDTGETGEREEGDSEGVVRALFRATESELLGVARRKMGALEGLQPVAARFSGSATLAQLRDLRSSLLEWLRRCEANRDREGDARFEFGGMVSFYISGSASQEHSGEGRD